jgi:hypothetical protein
MPLPQSTPPVLQVAAWTGIRGLVHGFFGRQGGVSRGAFAELNVSSAVGDASRAVTENWALVAAAVGGNLRFVGMTQVHGTRVLRVSADTIAAGEADALMTSHAGLALSILTADCIPVLLVDPRRRIAAAAHAGWRGTLDGVVDSIVTQLEAEFGVAPRDLLAALGPSIGGCCYEVEEELAVRLAGRVDCTPETHKPGKARVDLRRINATLLCRAGVPPESISISGPCTSCASTDYFSHRAAAGVTGRQISFVAWRN